MVSLIKLTKYTTATQIVCLTIGELSDLKSKQLALLVFLTQGIGVIFYGIFLAAFYLPLPSNETLIGDPIFRLSLSIFGGIFLILIAVSLMASRLLKQEE
jgi:hypothetical protein